MHDGVAHSCDVSDHASCLRVIQEGDRTVEYAVIGDERSSPVLVFYPMGACCRMVALMAEAARASGCRLICVNRPGMGATSPTPQETRVAVACSDAAACLDHLAVPAASVLFLCAGAPFALAFCTLFPERITGKVAGCSTWVSPTDCPDARFLYRLGAGMPGPVVRAAAGAVAHCFQSMPVMPLLRSFMPYFGTSGCDAPGSVQDKEIYGPSGKAAVGPLDQIDECEFALDWVTGETGGEGEDASVLLDGAKAWGVTYRAFRHPILLVHGDADETVPIECAEWLLHQLPQSSALIRICDGTHEDVMFSGFETALRLLQPNANSNEGQRSAAFPGLAATCVVSEKVSSPAIPRPCGTLLARDSLAARAQEAC